MSSPNYSVKLIGFGKEQEAAASRNFVYSKKARFKELRSATLHPLRPSTKYKDGVLYSADGGVWDAQGKFFRLANNRRLELEPGGYFDAEHPLAQTPVTATFSRAIFGGVIYDHYGHFVLESLSRLWLPILFGRNDLKILFLVPEGFIAPAYMQEIFFRLGLLHRIEFVRITTFVDQLIVPRSSVDYMIGAYSELLAPFRKLSRNSKFRKVTPTQFYVTRSNLNAALAIPEEEVEEIFRSEGWDVISPEEFTIDDQISLFSNANRIAGLTGSGMHNLLFSKSGVNVCHINRFDVSAIFLPTFVMIDQLIGANATYIHGLELLDPIPTTGRGPFFLNINTIYKSLQLCGIVTRKVYSCPGAQKDAENKQKYRRLAIESRAIIGNTLQRDDILDAAREMGRANPIVIREYARRLINRGEAEEGIKELRRAFQLDPQNAETIRCLIDVCSHVGLKDEAAELIEALQAQNASDDRSLRLIAQSLVSLGKFKEAVEYLSKVRRMDLETINIRMHMAKEKGNNYEFYDLARNAYEIAPLNHYFAHQVSSAAQLLGRHDEAAFYGQITCDLQPNGLALAERCVDLFELALDKARIRVKRITPNTYKPNRLFAWFIGTGVFLLVRLGEKLEIIRLRALRFDGEHYLCNNPDVAAAGMDPLEHYVRYGRREDRAFRFRRPLA